MYCVAITAARIAKPSSPALMLDLTLVRELSSFDLPCNYVLLPDTVNNDWVEPVVGQILMRLGVVVTAFTCSMVVVSLFYAVTFGLIVNLEVIMLISVEVLFAANIPVLVVSLESLVICKSE